MKSMEGQTWCCLASLLIIAGCVNGDFVEPSQPVSSMNTLSEGQTRLPCQYKAEDGQDVVQVTWYNELKDGNKEQIITAHYQEGHQEFGRYSGRVRFESNDPTKNSALLILSTEESDGGSFICHIATFPNGNFERRIKLTVWVSPISSLEPVILTEGQDYGVVAFCRAIGRPIPHLSWDSDLSGRVHERTNEGGSVSSYYSLHPLRSMNGKKLDCMVSHPSLPEPRRISNHLVVQYPPEPTISTSPERLHEGLENAEMLCEAGGNPKPHNITWTWNEGDLPVGVSLLGDKLFFGRAIHVNDSGIYTCSVSNKVGHGKAEIYLRVSDHAQSREGIAGNNLLLIIIGAAAGGLVLVLVITVLLVNRHHRNRNKKLEIELSEKNEEINSFSRQNSIRGLNSFSSDPRLRGEDYSGLRVDSRMKNSQVSLERPAYRGSQSTLGGKWGPPVGVELDELGRPVVWQDGRERGAEMDGEKEERRRRVESYLKNSNMSLDSGLPSSLVPLKAQQEDGSSSSPREPDLSCHRREGDPHPHQQVWVPPRSVDEGHEDEEEDDGDSSSYQISEALTNHFYYSNGVLRPRPHSNAILLHPRGQII